MLRLTHIELLGFKSFPHKTGIDIDPGVTSIVGPNGSGKSNIGDAIMFAFGSQSGHELRAKRLSSLIFAGTDKLRPLNMAAVTLHFERTAADLPAADDFSPLHPVMEDEFDVPEISAASSPAGSQLGERVGFGGTDLTHHVPSLEYELADRTPGIIRELEQLQPGQRVSVTRRVFRDGTGGYYINDEPVRLKDIDQFFDRFNLGRSAVFSINQGEVEKKILATPQEMREWLAEATGIALLLQQKSRAQQKLKRTRQNLERLEDIRDTTRELVHSLAGQRKTAESYQQFAAQLRAVELYEIRREIEFSQKQQEQAAKALAELKDKIDATREEYQGHRRAAEQSREQRTQSTHELTDLEMKVEHSRQEIARLEREAAVMRETAESSASAASQAEADAAEMQQQLAELEQEIEACDEEMKTVQANLDKLKDEESAAKAVVEEARSNLVAVSTRQDELKERRLDLAQSTAKLNNEIEALNTSGKQLSGQLEARRQQLSVLQGRHAQATAERTSQDEQAKSLAGEVAQRQTLLEQQNNQINELLVKIEKARGKCARLRDELAESRSRRLTLEELAAELEARDGGAERILDEPGLSGLVARATELTFAEEHRPAFTRLLAHLGDALIAGHGAVNKAHELLRESQQDALLLTGGSDTELHPQSLWRQAEGSSRVIEALRALLGDVVLTRDLATAHKLLEDNSALGAAVLADGSALVGRGFAFVGQPSAEKALKVSKLSDLANLATQTRLTESSLAKAEEQLKTLQQDLGKLQWDRDETSARLAADQERERHSEQLGERLARNVEELEAELELIKHNIDDLESERKDVAELLPRKQEELSGVEREVEAGEAEADEVARLHLEAGARVEDARSELARCVTRRELAGRDVKHLQQKVLDIAERAQNQRNRLKQLQQRIEALHTESGERGAEAQRLAAEAAELKQSLDALQEKLAALRGQQQELDDSAARSQDLAARSGEALSRLEQDQAGLASQQERATERVAEWLAELEQRYNMTLSQLIGDPTATAVPPGSGIDASEAGRGKLREERARLKAEIDALGAVNLLAIEQHQEQSTRLAFLDNQADELTRAIGDLAQLVVDLDRRTERQYRANLKRIETRFNELYLQLFGSGWARLRFEDPADIINCGVEVEVQLPGSRRHSLRSLSGGQRSLIFIALFFAVHSVRSPGFCILDEADAALDDANVERFIKLIREFADDEQFIVITHNKQTMETADRLVGVVGRPKGVSNLLEVDLRQARRMVDSGQGVA